MGDFPFAVPAKYVAAARHNGKLLQDHNQFLYNKSRSTENKSFWVCQKKVSHGCRVTATVLINSAKDDLYDEAGDGDIIISIRGEHSHDSDILAEVSKQVVKQAVARASKDLNITPRAVMADISSTLQNTGNSLAVYHTPKKATIARQVHRARDKEMQVPPLPMSWLDVKVPEVLTVNNKGERFLIMEENIETHRPEMILGFASPDGIDIMLNATQFFADGTFQVCNSTLFYQLFVIISTTPTGVNVPTAYFLLPGKEVLVYKKILLCLKKDHGVPDPPIFHCDFESAIIKAVREVFPTTKILCCDTHFKRAIRSNIQSNNLMKLYNSDPKMQQFVRYIWALTLIPEADIVDAWCEFVQKQAPDLEEGEWHNVEPADMENFINYVANTWIGGINSRTGKQQNPKFRHHLWNKHQAILENQDMTTNSSEGYNLQLKNSIPKGANLWKVIYTLIKEDSLMAIKLREAAIGPTVPPNHSRISARIKRKTELKNLVSRYGDMIIQDFMEMAVVYYNDTN